MTQAFNFRFATVIFSGVFAITSSPPTQAQTAENQVRSDLDEIITEGPQQTSAVIPETASVRGVGDDPEEKPNNIVWDELGILESAGQGLFGGLEDLLGESSLRLFQPATRIYFDSGNDDPNEPDIFDDGSLVPVINLAEIRFTNHIYKTDAKRYKKSEENTYTEIDVTENGDDKDGAPISLIHSTEDRTPWSWGFATGLGASVASDSGDDSTAAVILFTAGMFLEYDLTGFGKSNDDYAKWSNAAKTLGLPGNKPTASLEAGWAYGVSADEMFSDNNDDSAFYLGASIYIPF